MIPDGLPEQEESFRRGFRGKGKTPQLHNWTGGMARPETLHDRGDVAEIVPEISACPENQDEAPCIRVSDPEVIRHEIFPPQSHHERVDENGKTAWIRIRGRKMEYADLSPSESA